jgi:hypothetical protein
MVAVPVAMPPSRSTALWLKMRRVRMETRPWRPKPLPCCTTSKSLLMSTTPTD